MLPSIKTIPFFNNAMCKKEDIFEDNNISGKQRTFPSERNQFVVHVFVSLAEDKQIQEIKDEFSYISEKIYFVSQPHISLIRGHYAVQYHQIDPLMDKLSNVINSYNKFSLCLSNVKLFSNEEKSRYFVAICENNNDFAEKINPNKTQVKENQDLIKSIYNVLIQYRSELYETSEEKIDKFTYHTSIAWFLPEFHDIGLEVFNQIKTYFKDRIIFQKINEIGIKIGHRNKIISLR